MDTCKAHSGVCTAQTDTNIRVDGIEKKHDDCTKTVVRNKLFYTLIGILCMLFAAIFNMGHSLGSSIGKIEQHMAVQAVTMEHINKDIESIKRSLP